MRRRKALVAAALLVAGAATEVGLRATLGLGRPPLSYADPDYGYAFQANQDLRRFGNRVRLNSAGLRSEEVSAAPAAGVVRVLCVGDSVTFGGVLTDQAETYPYLLEAELKRRGVRVEALNASAGSWGVENGLAWLRKRGLSGASVVELQIGTHDLWQGKSTGEKVGEAGMPDRNPPLALVELVERYAWPRVSERIWPPPPFPAPREEDRLRCLRAIGETVELVRERGARPVILLTPDRVELSQPELNAHAREGLFGLASEAGVPVVDMLAAFRAEPDGGEGSFRDGVHPNEKGNRVIAQALAERVAEIVER